MDMPARPRRLADAQAWHTRHARARAARSTALRARRPAERGHLRKLAMDPILLPRARAQGS